MVREMDPIEQFLSGYTLLGIPALLLVIVLVQGIKSLGLRAEWATAAAMLIGMIVAAAIAMVRFWPPLQPWVEYALLGVLLGLAASGAYSWGKTLREAQ